MRLLQQINLIAPNKVYRHEGIKCYQTAHEIFHAVKGSKMLLCDFTYETLSDRVGEEQRLMKSGHIPSDHNGLGRNYNFHAIISVHYTILGTFMCATQGQVELTCCMHD